MLSFISDFVRKRDVWYILAILYFASKVYVAHTPNPNDDDIPDKVKDAVIQILD